MVHCDAITFVEMAQTPSRLLDPREIQKSRPLFVAIAALVGYPIDTFVDLVRPATKPNIRYYLGFLLINLVTVSAALLCFARLLDAGGASSWSTVLLAVPLLSNDVTKAFFWTAHSQMFNILAPVLAVLVGYQIATSPRMPAWKFLATAFVLGIFLLVYGTFLALLPTIVLAYWFSHWRHGFDWRRMLLVPAGAALFFGLPTLVWATITVQYAGRYFNREIIQYRQLVWILDALREGPGSFLTAFWRHSISFAHTLWQPDVVLVAMLTFIVYLIPRESAESRLASDRARMDALQFVALAAFASVCAFFWMLGFYERRLTFAVVPSLLCVTGLRLARTSLSTRAIDAGRAGAAAVAAVWVIYHVAKYGPFS